MRSVHSQKLEQWLGAETLESMSKGMRGWYGNPIALANVPGRVYATGDGDFIGNIDVGGEANIFQFLWEEGNKRLSNWARAQRNQLNMGFSSLASIRSEATKATRQVISAQYTAGASNSLIDGDIRIGSQPTTAYTSIATLPNGYAPNSSDTAALRFKNPISGRTTHLAELQAHIPGVVSSYTQWGVLIDKIFVAKKNTTITTTETVSGVPTRYQAASGQDSAASNFIYFYNEGSTTSGSVAHNWTTCLYTNQAGTTNQTLPSFAGKGATTIASGNCDTGNTMQFFAPLATGDTGIKALTQLQISAALTGGTFMAAIAHPIAMLPMFSFNTGLISVVSALNFERIYDDAHLTTIWLSGGSSTGVNITATLIQG